MDSVSLHEIPAGNGTLGHRFLIPEAIRKTLRASLRRQWT